MWIATHTVTAGKKAENDWTKKQNCERKIKNKNKTAKEKQKTKKRSKKQETTTKKEPSPGVRSSMYTVVAAASEARAPFKAKRLSQTCRPRTVSALPFYSKYYIKTTDSVKNSPRISTILVLLTKHRFNWSCGSVFLFAELLAIKIS